MPKTNPKAILVVDDDIDIRDTLAQVLEDEGYEVASAGNGREALAYLNASEEIPALILLDLMMPVMNGVEFNTERAKIEKLSQIPLVVITASGNSGMKTGAIHAAGMIQKPIPLEVLLETVSKFAQK